MRALRFLALASLLGPSLASAAPLTFFLDHGSITAAVYLGGSRIGSAAGLLSGGYVTFDAAAATIPDFSLQSANLHIRAPSLPGPYNALDLAVSLDPGAGYGSSGSGSGPFTITLGPIDISYAGSVSDSTIPVTVTPYPVSGVVALSSFTVTAYYNAGLMRLGLLGVKLAEISMGGSLYEVRGDIEFVGFAVPEPAVAGLLAAGALALAALRRR